MSQPQHTQRPAHPLIPLHGIAGAGPCAPRGLPLELRAITPRPTASRDIADQLRQHPDALALPNARLMREITDHYQIGRTAARRALLAARSQAA